MASAVLRHGLLLSSTLITLSNADITLPSSCVEQEDGSKWLKLMDDTDDTTYPAVRQLCHNEFMVIDVNEDPNVVDYFSSYMSWHYALSGPDLMDTANWEEWWLPSAKYIEDGIGGDEESDDYFQFAISPDCNTCDLDNNVANNVYSRFNADSGGERTAYYMTGTIFGCLAKHKAMKDCRWDYDTYTCGFCTYDDSASDLGYNVVFPDDDDWDDWGQKYDDLGDDASWQDLQMSLCGVQPTSSFTDMVPASRDECNEFQDNVKPSIGNNGKFCVCMKPHSTFDATKRYPVPEERFNDYQADYNEYHKEADADTGTISDVIELYQSDFEDGTYRIQKSGTYKIMEDIVFDFNAGDYENPNEGTAWWPTEDQQDMYPGAGSTMGNFYLGFLAGITVEVDDVVIDLNHHTIGMSKALYYQQRFFSVISLKSVAFPLNQGPGFFGFEPKFANNVVIKDGTIGLSSHHGIHGHYNKDVVIENVHIKDFETHGVQMSYFENLKMKNVEIGPSSTIAYLKGEYAYARWTIVALERIQEAGDYNDIFPVRFSQRDSSMDFDEIIETLRDLMDIAFKAVMGIEEYAEDDPDYYEAKQLFINEDGIPYGAVMYGLFLNLWVANVFTIHPSIKHASGAEFDNVYIHDLLHKTMEYRRLDKYDSAMYRNQFNSPLDADVLLGDQINNGYGGIMWSDVSYQGSALTDASITLAMVTNDWEELALTYMTDNFTNWALGKYKWPHSNGNTDTPYIGCNTDRMAHVPKGVMGIRMDGVENVMFRDLTISGLEEKGERGSDLCGDYWDGVFTMFRGRGNTLQNTPYLYGYTGNRAHGIFSDFAEYTLSGDTVIENVICDTGLVRGIGIYRSSDVTFAEDSTIKMRHLSAGSELWGEDTTQFGHPYNPSVAKPFHIRWVDHTNLTHSTDDGSATITKSFNSTLYSVPKQITIECVYGRDGTNDSDWFPNIDNSDCSNLDPTNQMLSAELANIHGNGHVAVDWTTLIWMIGALSVVVLFKTMWEYSRNGIKSSSLETHSIETDPLLH